MKLRNVDIRGTVHAPSDKPGETSGAPTRQYFGYTLCHAAYLTDGEEQQLTPNAALTDATVNCVGCLAVMP